MRTEALGSGSILWNSNPISKLPIEVRAIILSFLNQKSLLHLGQTSPVCLSVVKEYCWRKIELNNAHFPICKIALSHSPFNELLRVACHRNVIDLRFEQLEKFFNLFSSAISELAMEVKNEKQLSITQRTAWQAECDSTPMEPLKALKVDLSLSSQKEILSQKDLLRKVQALPDVERCPPILYQLSKRIAGMKDQITNEGLTYHLSLEEYVINLPPTFSKEYFRQNYNFERFEFERYTNATSIVGFNSNRVTDFFARTCLGNNSKAIALLWMIDDLSDARIECEFKKLSDLIKLLIPAIVVSQSFQRDLRKMSLMKQLLFYNSTPREKNLLDLKPLLGLLLQNKNEFISFINMKDETPLLKEVLEKTPLDALSQLLNQIIEPIKKDSVIVGSTRFAIEFKYRKALENLLSSSAFISDKLFLEYYESVKSTLNRDQRFLLLHLKATSLLTYNNGLFLKMSAAILDE